MKFFLFALLFYLICDIPTGYTMSDTKDHSHISRAEQLVNSILIKSAHAIEKKYSLKLSGEGSAMPEGIIDELTLAFDARGSFNKEFLRKILINAAQHLLNAINSDKEINFFLKTPPFKIENIQIIIYVYDSSGRSIYDPFISVAEIANGTLIYQTVDPMDTYKFKNEFKESYEEALQALLGP